MTTFAETAPLVLDHVEHQAPGAAAPLAPHEVESLVEEMASLSRGLFGLLRAGLGSAPAQEAAGGHQVPGLPVEQHPTGPVELPAEQPAPVRESIAMPATAPPSVASVPLSSVPMPDPVAETVSVPLPSLPMPDAGSVPASIPMPVPPARTDPALAAALLDEISFLDD